MAKNISNIDPRCADWVIDDRVYSLIEASEIIGVSVSAGSARLRRWHRNPDCQVKLSTYYGPNGSERIAGISGAMLRVFVRLVTGGAE